MGSALDHANSSINSKKDVNVFNKRKISGNLIISGVKKDTNKSN